MFFSAGSDCSAAHPLPVKVSAIAPTYRRPHGVRRCAATLQAQDIDGLEIVGVDESLLDLIGGLPDDPSLVPFVRPGNAGPVAVRSRGIAGARGELICLTDQDCRPKPRWVQAILKRDYEVAGGFLIDFGWAASDDRAFCHACATRWSVITSVPGMIMHHDHALDLESFWRQHRHYGHGANTWQSIARARCAETFSRFAFYAGIFAEPLRVGAMVVRLARSALIVMAQAATKVGCAKAVRANGVLQRTSP